MRRWRQWWSRGRRSNHLFNFLFFISSIFQLILSSSYCCITSHILDDILVVCFVGSIVIPQGSGFCVRVEKERYPDCVPGYFVLLVWFALISLVVLCGVPSIYHVLVQFYTCKYLLLSSLLHINLIVTVTGWFYYCASYKRFVSRSSRIGLDLTCISARCVSSLGSSGKPYYKP